MRLALRSFVLLMTLPGIAAAAGFNGVHSPDGARVWAVGGAGTVFRSADGGATWAKYVQGGATLRSVHTLGESVWIAGDSGTLQRSTNGGASWTFATLTAGAALRSVAFMTIETGWVVGDSGTILKTTDGGETWQRCPAGTAVRLTAVAAVDSATIYAAGDGGKVLASADGGTTWAHVGVDGWDKNFLAIDARGDVVVVTGDDGSCYRSTNRGLSWRSLRFRTDSRSAVTDVALVSADTAWFCGGGGYLKRTADGGTSFRWDTHPLLAPLSSVYFLNRERGWACSGTTDAILRTTDGGATWNLPSGTAVSLSWAQRLTASASIGNTFVINPWNRRRLYAALGRFIYMSGDLGETWTQTATISPSGGSTHSFYISPKDTNHYVVAFTGGGDRIMRSTDRGLTWAGTIVRNFSSFGMPLEMDADHPDTLLFAPEDGYLYRSKDFGSTWDTLSRPQFNSPCDVQIVRDSASIVWVGDSGPSRISRSTDGGLTWSLVYNGSTSEIPTIANSSLNNSVGFATAWGGGGLQKTSTFGNAWSTTATTGSTWGVDIAKDDPNVVMFGVYGGGQSYLSTNAGLSFTATPLTGSNYAILTYDRSTYFAQQSGGVWKMTITYSVPTSNLQAVMIVSPNGGESWQYGSVHDLLWASSNVPSMKLEYRLAPGEPWQSIAAGVPSSSGRYAWALPPAASAAAQIRISGVAPGSPADTSDAPFSITVAGIAASPASLNLGQVGVGQWRRDTLHLTNTGTGTLVVFSAATSGGTFVAGRSSFTIPPGASDTLGILFQPDSVGAFGDTLHLSVNTPDPVFSVVLAGEGTPALAVTGDETPLAFRLEQNYPNPFNPSTTIRYALGSESMVTLRVFNTLGEEVAVLVNGRQTAGRHDVPFSPDGRAAGGALPSGVYFYRLQATPVQGGAEGGFSAFRKMVLVK